MFLHSLDVSKPYYWCYLTIFSWQLGVALNNISKPELYQHDIATLEPIYLVLQCYCIGESIPSLGIDNTTKRAMLVLYNDWWEHTNFWTPYMVNGVWHNSEIDSEFIASEKLIKQVNTIHMQRPRLIE